MAQEYLKINDIRVKVPDQDGYGIQFATTSTSDSDRTQDLVMHNTPIGTVESYSLKWSGLTLAEASLILRQVVNKASFKVHYLDVYSGKWKDGWFYAANFNITPIDLTAGKERIDSLSFNIVGVNPI